MKYLSIYRPAERNAPPSQVTQSSEFTQAVTPAVHAKVSKKRMWTGRVISILVVLLLLFDSFGLLPNPTPVAEAFVRLGIPVALSFGIGILGLVCTVLYRIRAPPFSVRSGRRVILEAQAPSTCV